MMVIPRPSVPAALHSGGASSKVAGEVLPAAVTVERGRIGERAAIAGLAGFCAVFALVHARRSEAFDLAVTLRLQRWRHRTLTRILTAASWPGFPPQSRVIPPVIIALLWLIGLRLEARVLALGWGASLLSTIVKLGAGRERPVAGVDLRVVSAPLGGSSFPSGHVITYVGFYGTLCYLAFSLVRATAARRIVVGGLASLVALVGPSRVFLGHHWPTDVTASYLLGTTYLVGVTDIYRRAKARQAGVRP
jgi:membrane-associated phospholipid phosphatase